MKIEPKYDFVSLDISLDHFDCRELLGILQKLDILPTNLYNLAKELQKVTKAPMHGLYTGSIRRSN